MFHALEPWAKMWGESLWCASWQGAIVVAIAWVIARWCTYLSPRLVCWVWRLACLKLLVSLIWIQPLSIPLLPSTSFDAASIKTALPRLQGSEVALESPQRERTGTILPVPPAQHRTATAWRSPLLLLWLAGVFYQFFVIARQYRSAWQGCRLAEPASSAVLQQACRQEAERLAVRRPQRLKVSSRVDSPFLVGILRPTIVLPARAEDLYDRTELGIMLAHELAHLKRHDLLWNWLLVAVRFVFFFTRWFGSSRNAGPTRRRLRATSY
jgi:beta-lactamase regulating signal transducer with metallopeptidase domain